MAKFIVITSACWSIYPDKVVELLLKFEPGAFTAYTPDVRGGSSPNACLTSQSHADSGRSGLAIFNAISGSRLAVSRARADYMIVHGDQS